MFLYTSAAEGEEHACYFILHTFITTGPYERCFATLVTLTHFTSNPGINLAYIGDSTLLPLQLILASQPEGSKMLQG